jgi:hypothetical protein
VGQKVASYGDAAALVQQSGWKGRTLFLWDGLFQDPNNSPAITKAVVMYMIGAAKK